MRRGQERRPGSSRALRRNPEQTAVRRPTIKQREDFRSNPNHLIAVKILSLLKRCLDNVGDSCLAWRVGSRHSCAPNALKGM